MPVPAVSKNMLLSFFLSNFCIIYLDTDIMRTPKSWHGRCYGFPPLHYDDGYVDGGIQKCVLMFLTLTFSI